MKKISCRVVILALILNLAACGTLLYPERMGQRHSNTVDIKIAVLDGIGLLFFIVPGLVAFAVDYNQGTIYLPPNPHRSSLDKEPTLQVVKTDQIIDNHYLETLIRNELKLSVDLDAKNSLTSKQGSLEQVRLLNGSSRTRN